jgi:glucan phosphoethanolaminetransferase (alkaline phosphatase superfamily)
MVWLIILAFIALLIAGIALANQVDYSREWKEALLFIPLIICVWLLCVFAYNRSLDYERGKCAKWSEQTGYETKYTNIGYGDWQCYGKTSGKWLPIERIRGIED